MKLVINSENLKVSIEAKGNLDERHVISAYQLATGDFKALFVEEEPKTETGNSDIIELGKGVSGDILPTAGKNIPDSKNLLIQEKLNGYKQNTFVRRVGWKGEETR